MYFKKLEIFGFKSFADKTTLNFGSGITAVVGPNGCGKSNIFDSIRWVLGEQSVKELRGSSMEDVIFNGTDKKSGLGFAEVSLTFSNEKRFFPVDFNEVTITRRLFRSGESEYLLNKSVVRLKDINELLMGTGIGAEAYSLVQQGKVDLVVSARPEERRVIFDEASGITKYKSKRKEALNKLKDTENNLLRINDIVIEVKRQIASIERQANKARRYKEEYEKLKAYEIHLAKLQLRAQEQERGRLKSEVQEMLAKEARLNAEMAELNNLIEHEEGILVDIEQKINEVHSEEIKFDNQIDIEQRQISFNDERLANLTANEDRLNQQKNLLSERCRQQEEKVAELRTALGALQQSLEANKTALASSRENLHAIATLIQQHKDTIRQDEEKIMELTSRQVKVKNELTEIMKEVQGALARKRRLEMEAAKVTAEKQEIDLKLQNINRQIEEYSAKLTEVRNQQEVKSQTLQTLKTRLGELQHSLGELEKTKLLLISQKEFIEKLRVQYEDIPDPVVEGRLITHVPPLERHTGIIGKVRQVQPVSEAQRELFRQAGHLAQGPLYEIVCESKFIELDPQEVLAKINEVTLQIDLETTQREETITRVGEEQAQIDTLMEDLRSYEKSMSVFESQKSDVLKDVNKLKGELDLVDLELAEATELLAGLKLREDRLSVDLSTSSQEIQLCQQGIKDKQSAIESKSKERETVSVAIAQMETEISSHQGKENSLMDSLKVFTDSLGTSREEITQIDEDLNESALKKTKLEEETLQLIEKIESIKREKSSLVDALAQQERERADASQRLNSKRRQVNSMESEIIEIKTQMHNQEMKEQELSFGEKAIKDKLQQSYKVNFDELVKESDSSVEEKMTPAAESPLAESAATAELSGDSTSGSATAETKVESSPAAPAPQPAVTYLFSDNPDDLSLEIERLKKRCDSYGTVNLVAIEEYEELRQRFEFLTKQQSDLLSARESLHSTIQKINRQTRQMFLETFTKVGEEFRIYFRMLFGGGEAQLVLMDPENVLESGIEIIARPPGKKLQNISLLSGGEKTLTAIALIFGVFKVRPSPFCVLDEIDAALDESNVGRFGYLLKEFSSIAQFIVITHNKKTIAQADVMYGITMQETGVSKIVSVKFGDGEKKDVPNEEVSVTV